MVVDKDNSKNIWHKELIGWEQNNILTKSGLPIGVEM